MPEHSEINYGDVVVEVLNGLIEGLHAELSTKAGSIELYLQVESNESVSLCKHVGSIQFDQTELTISFNGTSANIADGDSFNLLLEHIKEQNFTRSYLCMIKDLW